VVPPLIYHSSQTKKSRLSAGLYLFKLFQKFWNVAFLQQASVD
jgi:hypothetical protein